MKYPDITEYLPQAFANDNITSFILDCETVAYNKEKKSILGFQVLTTRANKDVTVENITVPYFTYFC